MTKPNLPRKPGRRPSRVDARRVQFDFATAALERLDELQDRTEATSRAEVVRNALRLLELLIDAREEGATLYIERKDGSKSEISVVI